MTKTRYAETYASEPRRKFDTSRFYITTLENGRTVALQSQILGDTPDYLSRAQVEDLIRSLKEALVHQPIPVHLYSEGTYIP